MTDLPPDWEFAKLGEVARWSSGGTPKSDVSEFYGGDIPWVVTGDLTDGLVHATKQTLTPSGLARSSAKLVPSGTVLVAMYGASIGRVGIAGMPLTTNQAIANAQVYTQAINPKYLLYYLLSQRSALAAAGKGAAQPNIGQGILKDWPIPVAPLSEQERIIAAIEEQFSRLDAGEAALKRARLNLKRMRAAVLQAAVTSVEQEGVDQVALGDLVTPERKIAYGVLVPGNDIPDGIAFIRVGDLERRGVNSNSLKRIAPSVAARYPRTHLQGGEVLLSLVGTIGRTAVVPKDLVGANVARALAVIPVRLDVEARYVAIALSLNRVTRDLTNLSHEVARKTLNLEDVRKYKIPIPSRDRQLAIVEIVENTETWITSIERHVNNVTRRSNHLRSAVLAGAFSGQLVPQNPADEPASVVLERMAMERLSSNGHQSSRNRTRRTKATT